MTDARNVGGNFHTIGKTDAGDLRNAELGFGVVVETFTHTPRL